MSPDQETSVAHVRDGLHKAAAVLLPGSGALPPANEVESFDACLDRVLGADPGLLPVVRTVGEHAAAQDSCTLPEIKAWAEGEVDRLVFAFASAYYIAPEVLRALKYPGQIRRPISQATAEEKYSEELLAPVRERGEIYVPTPSHLG